MPSTGRRKVARHVDDLPDVIGEMRDQPVQRFHDEKRFAANPVRVRSPEA
jgi:hypothetical protein